MNDKQVPDFLRELAGAVGGRIEKISAMPDGSGFATMSMPLPKDHWAHGPTPEPPMPFRMAIGPLRTLVAERIREAGRYAYLASTMGGKETDLDPDALLQNLIVGLLGYRTSDGTYAGETEVRAQPDPSQTGAIGSLMSDFLWGSIAGFMLGILLEYLHARYIGSGGD